MAAQVHVIPHFHWDREWYFTAEESKILLVSDMDEILTMLEERDDYPYFILDGQTAILEDYFSVKPENRERVKRLAETGKLVIGPWYTQTDEMVVGGESIVRNLLYGLKDCKELGPPMKIGYLPDSFGQSARMPQILNGFGITRSMFWRGTSERMGTSKTEFLWKDDDGSQVMVQLLPLGYAIGKYLPTEHNKLKKRMDKYLPVLDAGAVTEHILLPNGHDQMPVQKNIFQVMAILRDLYPERDFFLSRYEKVFEELEKQENLAVLTGEFLDGKYMRVHRSIYSSRADLKSANTRIENKLVNLLEPLASIAYKMGFEYHHGLLEAIWRELMKNHAHDSIGCCCSDRVHRAIADRFFLAEERTDHLIAFYMRRIADAVNSEPVLDKLLVFNMLPYKRKGVFQGEIITKMKNFCLEKTGGTKIPYHVIKMEVVDAGLIDRQIVHYGDYEPFVRYTVLVEDTVPAMGYQTYLVRPGKGCCSITYRSISDSVLENELYRIAVAKNGTLTVFDKIREQQYKDVLLIEDGSDDGDGYDYSALRDDFIITSADAEANITCWSEGLKQTAVIEFQMNLPKDLESRKQKVSDGFMEVRLTVELKQGARTVDVTFEAENCVKDHRVRVLLPCGGRADYSVSDNQFGVIRRPVHDEAMDIWELESWSERPDAIYPFLSYVTSDCAQGLGIITNSVREYEIAGDNYEQLAITMFRSVGVLGKENLLRRPGRPSGIKMETPDSQLQGRQVFAFSFTTEKEHLPQLAKETLTPLLTYSKMPYNAMKLNPVEFMVPDEFSFITEETQGVVMSVLKKSENAEGLIIRFYNGSFEQRNCSLTGKFTSLEAVNLNEELLGVQKERTILQVNQVRSYLLRW